MKKKIFDRRGAGIELAILMMVVSFSMSILLTSVALIQSTNKVRAEERLQQSIALEQLGQDFLSAVLKGDVDGWTQNLNNKNNHTGHTEQATAHQWGEWSEDTATCTEAGTQTRACTVCGIQDKVKTTAVLGHSYNSVITKEASCIEEGIKTFTCTTCGDSYTESIPMHNLAVDEEQSSLPTCTDGGTAYYVCSDCGETKEETIPALGHSYDGGVITTPPTCDDAGEKTFTCETCGDESYTEEIPASHTWGEDNKCTLCGETKPFEGKWDDAYELIVYKNGDSFDVYVTITASNDEACEPEDANLEVVAYDGDAEAAEPAGNQVLVIRVEKVEDTENAENEFTYKITEWTKNDRS